MTALVWLVPAFPAAGAAINGLFGIRWFSRAVTAAVACASMLGSLALAIACTARVARMPIARAVVLGEWIPPIPAVTLKGGVSFHASWTLLIDPLAAVMALVVTGVGSLIHVYSVGYMKDDPGYGRFFACLNLFLFFMLLLVLGRSLLVLFVGWEGVGLASYLLIGFWFDDVANDRVEVRAGGLGSVGNPVALQDLVVRNPYAATRPRSGTAIVRRLLDDYCG